MNRLSNQELLSLLKAEGIESRFAGELEACVDHGAPLDRLCEGSLGFTRDAGYVNKTRPQEARYTLIVPSGFDETNLGLVSFICVDEPDLAFRLLARQFLPAKTISISPDSAIDSSATVGEEVTVGAFTYIDSGVTIGSGVEIGTGVTLEFCEIGDSCVIGSGVRLGSPGLGSVMDRNGEWIHFPHLARLRLGRGVTVQENTVINRGTLTDTFVDDGAVIGPMCWIAHGVVIEKRAFIAQGVTIAGSVHVGRGAKIWGNASIRDGVTIGEGAVVGLGAVVLSDVPAGETWVGNPARCITTR